MWQVVFCCCFRGFALKELRDMLKWGVFGACDGLKVGGRGKISDKKCKETRIWQGVVFGVVFGWILGRFLWRGIGCGLARGEMDE